MKSVGDLEEIIPAKDSPEILSDAEEFYPRGAIAFFVSMLIGFALIWAGLYLVMVHRAFHL